MRIRGLIVLMAFAVFCAPLCADHAPSKRKASAEKAAKVTERLVQLGMDKTAADRQVKALTEKEIAYFAADTQRIQIVGASQDMWSGEADLIWYELVLGAGMIVGAGVAIFFAQSN